MKVWIVIENNEQEYEDYREWVEAVFDSKEKAEIYVAEQIDYHEYNEDRFTIEDHEVE